MSYRLLQQNGIVSADSFTLAVSWKPGGLCDVTATRFNPLVCISNGDFLTMAKYLTQSKSIGLQRSEDRYVVLHPIWLLAATFQRKERIPGLGKGWENCNGDV